MNAMLLTVSVALSGVTWQDLPPMPVGVAGGASALAGGKLLYAGGTTWVDGVKQWLRDVRQYDLAARSWSRGPDLPEPLAYGGSVATADGLEIFGGMNQNGPSRNCWRWNSNLTRWTKHGVLPQDGALARVERAGKADYLFGGCSDVAVPMRCSNSVWKRDNLGKWTRVGDMPDGPVAVRAGAVLDGRVYLFGGCSEIPGGVVNRDDAYRYDPATGEWRKLRPLPVPARGMSAASLDGGRILLAGGYATSTHYGFSNQVWIYDTRRDRYQSATPLPFAVSGIEIVVHQGAIFALGGEDRMRSRSRRFVQGNMQ